MSVASDHTSGQPPRGPRERPSLPDQESFISALAYDPKAGAVLADLLEPDLFEGDFRTIAERVIGYWREYALPPKSHLTNLLSDFLTEGHPKRETFIRLTIAIVGEAEHPNSQFVIDRAHAWRRQQQAKRLVLEAAEKMNAGRPEALEELVTKANDLVTEVTAFDPGMRLSDTARILSAIERRGDAEFSTGIEELDRRQARPERGRLTLCLGPTGSGKTHWLVSYGKAALRARHKVLHVSLEMGEAEVAQRYVQTLEAVPEFPGEQRAPRFIRDDAERLIEAKVEACPYDFALSDKCVPKKMERIAGWGLIANLRIKEFLGHKLTVNELRAYLRTLKVREGFEPDMLIVDYVGILAGASERELRHELARALVGLRNIAREFNCACITAQQTNRAAYSAPSVSPKHVAEAFALNMDADQVLTYSQTDAERAVGIARITVAKNRNAADKYVVAIAQNYGTCQFALDSVFFDEDAKEILASLTGRRTSNVVDIDNDQLSKLKEMLSESMWRVDVRAKDWAGKALMNVMSIDQKRAADTLDDLIERGVLETFKAADKHREVRTFVRFADESDD